MAQRVAVFATNLDDLSSIPGIYTVEEKMNSRKLSSDLHIHVHTYKHTNESHKKSFADLCATKAES